jgi:hypothetical protein
MPNGELRTLLLETVKFDFILSGYSSRLIQTTAKGTRTPNLQEQRTAVLGYPQLSDTTWEPASTTWRYDLGASQYAWSLSGFDCRPDEETEKEEVEQHGHSCIHVLHINYDCN